MAARAASAWLAGPSSDPSPLTRDGAQHAAQAELAKHAYHRDDPSLVTRAIRWLADKLGDVLDAASRHSPGKGIGLLVIVVLVALVVIAVSVRVGRVRRSARGAGPILSVEATTARDHRRSAEEFARAHDWANAVREWLRATARELEQRGVLDPRPGRTAEELAAEASARLPGLARDLRRAASVFDEIWYGGRAATAADEESLRRLDAQVAGSHRALAMANSGAFS